MAATMIQRPICARAHVKLNGKKPGKKIPVYSIEVYKMKFSYLFLFLMLLAPGLADAKAKKIDDYH